MIDEPTAFNYRPDLMRVDWPSTKLPGGGVYGETACITFYRMAPPDDNPVAVLTRQVTSEEMAYLRQYVPGAIKDPPSNSLDETARKMSEAAAPKESSFKAKVKEFFQSSEARAALRKLLELR